MKNFFGGIFILLVFAAWAIANSGATSTSASPLDLPAVKRTAIYAPVAATQQSSAASSQAAIAQAQADEAEAARVYVQAATDERNKARAVATEQAALAAKTANDAMVSKEYATLSAVSLQATAQAISNTIETDRVAYAAQQAEIMATKQAATDAMLSRAQSEGVNAERDRFMTWVPVVVCLPTVVILIAIALYGLYLAVKRIGPQVDNSAIEQLRDEIEALRAERDEEPDEDPQVSKLSGLNFSTADPRVLLTNIAMYSGRHIGWRQNRIAGADEIGPSISDRAWGSAIEWGKKHYDVVTARGAIKNGGGTYAQVVMSEFYNHLVTDPPIDDSPALPGA